MIKSLNNYILAWKTIFLLLMTDIVLLLLNDHLRSQISNSNFLWQIYFDIPVLLIILYVFLTERPLIRSFLFKIELLRWDRYFWFLAILAGFFFLLVSLSSNIKVTAFLVQIVKLKAISNNLSFVYYIKTILLAPVTEEILFRGIILSGFLIRFSPIKAILLSSLFFSFFHLNIFQFVTAFPIGLLIGWYYFKTRNLLSCIIIHSVNNIIAVIALKYFINKLSHQFITPDATLLQIDNLGFYIFMSISIIIIGLFYLYSSLKDNLKEQLINE